MADITTINGIALQTGSDHIYEVTTVTNVGSDIDDVNHKVFKIMSSGKFRVTTGNTTTFTSCTFLEEDNAGAYGTDNYDNGTGPSGPRFNGIGTTVFKGCTFKQSNGISRSDWDIGIDSYVQFVKNEFGGFCEVIIDNGSSQSNHFASSDMKIDGLKINHFGAGAPFELRTGPYDINDLIIVDNNPSSLDRHVVILMYNWPNNSTYTISKLSCRNIATWYSNSNTKILILADPIKNIMNAQDSYHSSRGILELKRTYKFEVIQNILTGEKTNMRCIITSQRDDVVVKDSDSVNYAVEQLLIQWIQGYLTYMVTLNSIYRRALVKYGYIPRVRSLDVDWDETNPSGINEGLLLAIPDTNITEYSEVAVGAYTILDDGNKLYDRMRYYEINRTDRHFVGDQIVTAFGTTIDIDDSSLIINGASPNAFIYDKTSDERRTISTNAVWAQGSTVTIESGNDRLLEVAVGSQDSNACRTITSIIYGGQTLTKITRREIQDTQNAQPYGTVDVWYLNEAGIIAATDTNITVIWDTNPTDFAILRGVFNNVSQIRPIRGFHVFFDNDNSRSTKTTIVPCMDKSMVIAFALNIDDLSQNWTGNAIKQIEYDAGDFRFGVANYVPISDGSATMSLTSDESIIVTTSLTPVGDTITIAAGATFDTGQFRTIKAYRLTVEDGTVINGWDIDSDLFLNHPSDLTNVTISGNLYINTGANSTLNFDNVNVIGNVYNDDVSHTLTVNATNGSNLIAGDAGSDNGQTNIKNNVDISVIVQNMSGTIIEYARVLLEADIGGLLPSNESVTISRNLTTATVNHMNHGMSTGDFIIVRGANQYGYNGDHQITVIGVNTYTYMVNDDLATPATGTITATARIIYDITDSNGIVNGIFDFVSNQPIKGVARKSTADPLYKSTDIIGTITSSGYSVTVQLVID